MSRKFDLDALILAHHAGKIDARDFLKEAMSVMEQRAVQYDQENGERSMSKTIEAFNAITGKHLIESDGWLLMLLLKQVRQWSKDTYHHDSALDAVAYSALLAESLRKEKAREF